LFLSSKAATKKSSWHQGCNKKTKNKKSSKAAKLRQKKTVGIKAATKKAARHLIYLFFLYYCLRFFVLAKLTEGYRR